MSYRQEFLLPYPVDALFMVGLAGQATTDGRMNIAICWNEGSPILNRIRAMKPVDLQKLQDQISHEIVQSMKKRIPAVITIY